MGHEDNSQGRLLGPEMWLRRSFSGRALNPALVAARRELENFQAEVACGCLLNPFLGRLGGMEWRHLAEFPICCWAQKGWGERRCHLLDTALEARQERETGLHFPDIQLDAVPDPRNAHESEDTC